MSDGAAGFTALGLLPAAHEQSDNRHRSIAIVPTAIAGSLKLLAFSAVTSQMPETTESSPLARRIPAIQRWSTDLAALIEFLVRCRAHSIAPRSNSYH